jgi:hypothetical protein
VVLVGAEVVVAGAAESLDASPDGDGAGGEVVLGGVVVGALLVGPLLVGALLVGALLVGALLVGADVVVEAAEEVDGAVVPELVPLGT